MEFIGMKPIYTIKSSRNILRGFCRAGAGLHSNINKLRVPNHLHLPKTDHRFGPMGKRRFPFLSTRYARSLGFSNGGTWGSHSIWNAALPSNYGSCSSPVIEEKRVLCIDGDKIALHRLYVQFCTKVLPARWACTRVVTLPVRVQKCYVSCSDFSSSFFFCIVAFLLFCHLMANLCVGTRKCINFCVCCALEKFVNEMPVRFRWLRGICSFCHCIHLYNSKSYVSRLPLAAIVKRGTPRSENLNLFENLKVADLVSARWCLHNQ